MIVLGESDKKDKKGDGINAVLKLMQEIRDLQDKIDTAKEAQSIIEHKTKIEEFDVYVEKMYKTLLDLASQGIALMRNKPEIVKNPEPKIEKQEQSEVNIPVPPRM
jgi:predicted  nucleic acid-binding Zn-ribbon protein